MNGTDGTTTAPPPLAGTDGATPAPPSLAVAYLVNQYPHVSHTFIRREIRALELLGITVARFSIRPSPESLVDPADQEEARRTRVVLAAGALGLLLALLRSALATPLGFLRALGAAIRMGRRSDRGVLRHMVYLAEAAVLLGWLRAARARHLHAHFGTNPAAVAMLARMLGGPPYSITVHGPEEFDHPVEMSLPEKIAHASAVMVVSAFGRSQVSRWIPYTEWPKIHVVRCGVDGDFLTGGAQPVRDTTRLVCVGRLAEQKGQLLLLEAVAQLAADKIACEVILAGDGPMRAVVEQRARELGLTDRVRITGWLSNQQVRAELLAARVLLLPSFAEGLPVVLMEAMALGRPAITTYIAGIPELVTDGENGWLVPAGSTSALAGAIRRALDTPVTTLERMGVAAAAAVAEHHDVNREASRLLEVFQRLQRLHP